MPLAKSGTLIIGLGNEYRRDDAVGLVVARRLKGAAPAHVRVLEQSGEGAALMESWKNADTVILIDAVHCGAKPGTIHRIDAHTEPVPARVFRCSTHAFGVAEAIQLAKILDLLPPRMQIYGIEGKQFEMGGAPSTEVLLAVDEVAARIAREVGAPTRLS